MFDPEKYRAILFDQRGCGRSVPHASDPATDMSVNTTDHLVSDMEQLREHLGVEDWLLFGSSWGSTLSLAYAQTFPERVSELVIVDVTTSRQAEIDWLYGGVSRFFPEAWEAFVSGADGGIQAASIVSAYAQLMESPDLAVRQQAAHDWCCWEDAVLSGEPSGPATPYMDRVGADRLAFVRICTHYFSKSAWLEDEQLLRNAHRLRGIPGVLLHGRLDMSSPLDTAWQLARAWPDVELVVFEDAGHKGNQSVNARIRQVLDGFAG
jgi:proline iminopeptidase